MKVLALEKSSKDVDWSGYDTLLKEEAHAVHECYVQSIIREIYFNEEEKCSHHSGSEETKPKHNIVCLNCPFVRAGVIAFDLTELHPYSGFQRILSHG